MSKRKSDGWVSQRRDGRWNVGYGGKRTVRPTRAAALECLREMRVKGDKRGPAVLTDTMSVCAEHWLKNVLIDMIKPTTLHSYNAHLKSLLAQPVGERKITLGEMRARNITPADIRYAARNMRGVHGAKIALRVLSSCFRYYINEGLLTENPCDKVTLKADPTSIATEELAYNTNEMRAIISELNRRAANGNYYHKYRHAFILLANTGLRIGELLYLKWKHIDFESALLRVEGNREPQYDAALNKNKIADQDNTKTRSSTRTVPLNDAALGALEELRAEESAQPDDYVIQSRTGKPANNSAIYRSFNCVLRDAGVKRRKRKGAHSLRHTFASQLYRRGTPIDVISRLLGHSSVNVTSNIYVHMDFETLENAVGLLKDR